MQSNSLWYRGLVILLVAFLLAATCSSSTPRQVLASKATAPLDLGDLLSSQYISAGGNHTCGVKDNGNIFCWGANTHGQSSVPVGTFFYNDDFIQVSSGINHTCGVRNDATITCWGNNTQNQIDVPSPNAGFRQVSAGANHTCARKQDGSITCWGLNSDGQANDPIPNTGFTSVSAGGNHTCGRKTDGTFVCWGNDADGQLGTAIPNNDFRQIAAGTNHTCGLKNDRSLVCWGSNASGQATVPVPNTQFVGLSAGANHTCGLKGDGSIVCWGSNVSGESTGPVPNNGFAQVSAGSGHSCGIKTHGEVVCWGENAHYESNPFSSFSRLSAGISHTCGLRSNDSVFCWGENIYGQSNPPASGYSFVEVGAGDEISCGRTVTGSMVCWGLDAYNQTTVPTPNSGFTEISVGHRHACGLRSDGSIACTGDYTWSVAPAPNNNFRTVGAGANHTCGITTAADMFCWGVNTAGCTVPPVPIDRWTYVDAGNGFTCALNRYGGYDPAQCWGANGDGQSTPPTDLYSLNLSTGDCHACALQGESSGRIRCWGCNDSDQLDVPYPTGIYVDVSAGGRHTCGSRIISYSPFKVEWECWGDDSDGQSSLALTHFEVPAFNLPPTANDDSYSAVEDTQLAVPTSGVLINDSDPENDPLTAIEVSPPASGTVALSLDGSFTYDPDPDTCGPDSFTYLARTALADSNTATVSLTVDCVNDPPVATNLSAAETYTEDTSLNLIDISITDVDSPSVTATLTLSTTAAGTLSTATSGGVTSTFVGGIWTASGALADVNSLLSGLAFNPALDYANSFTITTRISDGIASPVVGSKAMTANPVNDPPTANNLSVAETYTEDMPLYLTDIFITDVDSPTVKATLSLSTITAGNLSTATSGSVTSTFAGGIWTASGALADVNSLLSDLTYNPAADYTGSFSIATTVSDEEASPLTGSKAVTSIPVNDSPSFTSGGDLSVAMNSGAYSGPWATSISAGPLDEFTQTLTFHANNNNPGLFSIPPAVASDGTLSFTPLGGAIGSAQVSIYLQDDGGTANGGIDSSLPEPFTITVSPYPVVTNVNVTAGDILIPPGGTVLARIKHLTISFDRDIDNPPGSTSTDDVSNPANYMVVQAGPNGIFDTVNCATGLGGDDVHFPSGTVVYNGMTFTAVVEMNSGLVLPDGAYRLFVCGTTSITAGGIALAGDGINSGTDYLLDFSVIIPQSLPVTGFAPDRHTPRPEQSAANAVSQYPGFWLDIPKLDVKMPIVGVPILHDTWDVNWLDDQAGWLDGTAFPTLAGNSVLTGHSINTYGLPGPFSELGNLVFGDMIIVHAWGQQYVYEVRAVMQVNPDQIQSVIRHEEFPWLTLFTCRGYDPANDTYRYRTVVRAVLVRVYPSH